MRRRTIKTADQRKGGRIEHDGLPQQGVVADPRSVLIVDDNEDIRHVLRLLFENDEFTIVGEAESGVGVLDLVREKRPAFVLLDMRMPGLSGDQIAEDIRVSAPDTRIVAFSAYLKEQPAWADAFLNKDRINQIPSLLRSLVEDGTTKRSSA